MYLKDKNDLEYFIKKIESTNKEICKNTKEYLDSLIKPIGSLGELENILIKLSSIKNKINVSIKKKSLIIMCSDNGVFDEGVASTPKYMTFLQTDNFIKNKNCVGVLSKQNNVELIVVDVGIDSDKIINGVYNRKIRKCTNNIINEAAMTYSECINAINTGIEMAKIAKENGSDIIGVGEMGIANTTTSSAVLIALTECDFDLAIGKGAGLTDAAFLKKKDVIKTAIKNNHANKNDVIDVLSKLGGFDIAAMVGVFLGAAYYKLPVVIDGFISSVACLAASRLCSLVKEYSFASHNSKEIGFKIAIDELGFSPILNLNMRLGEGSGCILAFSLFESACAIINNMSKFSDFDINCEYLKSIKNENNYIV